MPEDLRLYTPSNKITPIDNYLEETMDVVNVEAAPATSIEILAGKVVKFLLTYRGSDPFDPSYGGIALHHRNMSEQYLVKLRIEMLDDIDRCKRYIIDGEEQIADDDYTSERLFDVTLIDIVYNPRSISHNVDVYIRIASTSGKIAVVAITDRTDS